MALPSGPHLFLSTSLLGLMLSVISPTSSEESIIPESLLVETPDYEHYKILQKPLLWELPLESPTTAHNTLLAPELSFKGLIDIGSEQLFYLIETELSQVHIVEPGERIPGTHWTLEEQVSPQMIALKEVNSHEILQLSL